jgi:hypothetical protein
LIIDKFSLAAKGNIRVRNSGSGSATLTIRDTLSLILRGALPVLFTAFKRRFVIHNR